MVGWRKSEFKVLDQDVEDEDGLRPPPMTDLEDRVDGLQEGIHRLEREV